METKTAPTATKPPKPYPDFPLYAHNTKRWAQKIKGRTHFFGHWSDWKAALERFQYENDLQQGKTPPPQNVDALTVGDLVNTFLENREAKVLSGEMANRTFADSKRTGALLIEALGRYKSVESLTPDDFAKLRLKFSKGVGLVSLGNDIQRTRVIFNFAFKNEMIDRPVRMGLSFSKPSKQSVRKEKQTKPAKIFTVDELATIYKAANEVRTILVQGCCRFSDHKRVCKVAEGLRAPRHGPLPCEQVAGGG